MIIPNEICVIITQYLQIDECINYSICNKELYRICDNQDIWKKYVKHPTLYKNDLDLYHYSWKHLVLDRNRKSRCFVLDHVFFIDDESTIMFTTPEIQRVNGSSFSIMIYPFGNPHHCDNPCVSVYLKFIPSTSFTKCSCRFSIRIHTTGIKKIWLTDRVHFTRSLRSWGCHNMLSHDKVKNKNESIHVSIIGIVQTFLIQIVSTEDLYSHRGMNLSGMCTGYFIEESFDTLLQSFRKKIASRPNQKIWLFEDSPPYEYTPLYLLTASDDMKFLEDVFLSRRVDLYRIWVQDDDNTPLDHIPYFIKYRERLLFHIMMPPKSTKSDIEYIIGHTLHPENDTTVEPHIFTIDVINNNRVLLSYDPKSIIGNNFRVLCHDLERLGLCPSRIVNAFFQHDMKNVNQLFDFFTKKRHCGYCCDRCGTNNFEGLRYKCTVCDDYDFCHYCFIHQSDQTTHRYLFISNGKWKRKYHNSIHYKSHLMIRIMPYKILHRPTFKMLMDRWNV